MGKVVGDAAEPERGVGIEGSGLECDEAVPAGVYTDGQAGFDGREDRRGQEPRPEGRYRRLALVISESGRILQTDSVAGIDRAGGGVFSVASVKDIYSILGLEDDIVDPENPVEELALGGQRHERLHGLVSAPRKMRYAPHIGLG